MARETGGHETLEQIMALRLIRTDQGQAGCLPARFRDFFLEGSPLDQALDTLIAPERRRQRAAIEAAIRRVLEMIFESTRPGSGRTSGPA